MTITDCRIQLVTSRDPTILLLQYYNYCYYNIVIVGSLVTSLFRPLKMCSAVDRNRYMRMIITLPMLGNL